MKLITFFAISVTKVSLKGEQCVRCVTVPDGCTRIHCFSATFEEKKLASRSVFRRVPRDPAGSDVMMVRPACGGMEEESSRR